MIIIIFLLILVFSIIFTYILKQKKKIKFDKVKFDKDILLKIPFKL